MEKHERLPTFSEMEKLKIPHLKDTIFWGQNSEYMDNIVDFEKRGIQPNHLRKKQREEWNRFLKNLFVCLNEREKIIIKTFFFEEKTLASLEKSLGITESRISQIKFIALKKMKRYYRIKGKSIFK